MPGCRETGRADQSELRVGGGEEHLRNVPAAALRLLRRGVDGHIHLLAHNLHEPRVTLRRVHDGREVPHVGYLRCAGAGQVDIDFPSSNRCLKALRTTKNALKYTTNEGRRTYVHYDLAQTP